MEEPYISITAWHHLFILVISLVPAWGWHFILQPGFFASRSTLLCMLLWHEQHIQAHSTSVHWGWGQHCKQAIPAPPTQNSLISPVLCGRALSSWRIYSPDHQFMTTWKWPKNNNLHGWILTWFQVELHHATKRHGSERKLFFEHSIYWSGVYMKKTENKRVTRCIMNKLNKLNWKKVSNITSAACYRQKSQQ